MSLSVLCIYFISFCGVCVCGHYAYHPAIRSISNNFIVFTFIWEEDISYFGLFIELNGLPPYSLTDPRFPDSL